MQSPELTLKIIVTVHLILTTWATMAEDYLPDSYYYLNMVMGVIGGLAIVHKDSADAVCMYMVWTAISIINDIVLLGIYQPISHKIIEQNPNYDYSLRNTYRFSLGMTIVNLIIKPLTCFMMYRIWQGRGGGTDMGNLPGLPSFGRQGPYENIDQPVPGNTVETASPHRTVEN